MNENEPQEGAEIVRREVMAGQRVGDSLPKIGEWFWVKHKPGYYEPGYGKVEEIESLFCVEKIASNHVVFTRFEAEHEVGVLVGFEELLQCAEPEPEWRAVLETAMNETRRLMDEATRQLLEEGIKANAINDASAKWEGGTEASMVPALHITDPAVQKRKLVALKENIPLVVKKIDALAKDYAGHAKNLTMPEIVNLQAVRKALEVVEDKIFSLEIYAGLQEEVKQLQRGEPAPAITRLAVRQSLLFMDEEVLYGYANGGMDFTNIDKFDAWVIRPENLYRVLPEERGVVAFRVRRHLKDYGPSETLAEAWVKAKWAAYNLETYLLLRNGGNIYRIASTVDFSPRLVPLATEFNDAFTTKERGAYNFETRIEGPATVNIITPDMFSYDEHVEKTSKRLKHYQRIVLLLQGLLDRSEVFHPHPPINLASMEEVEKWLHLVPDEEGALEYPATTWEEYREAANAKIRPGDWCFTEYRDLRKRPYDCNTKPDKILQVYKVRKGTRNDAIPPADYQPGHRGEREHYGRDESKCVGVPGVEFKWPWGTRHGYEHGDWGRYGEWPVKKEVHMWVPLKHVFNLTAYRVNDYRQFLCDRRQKGRYLKWAPALLTAEDYVQGRREPKTHPALDA